MKKIAAILLLLVYSVSVSGAAFHLHFCGSYLQSISLAGNDHEECCCGKKMMDKNCCKDKEVVFKTKAIPHHATLCSASPKVKWSIPVIFHEMTLVGSNFPTSTTAWVYHSPPLRPENNKLFALNCVFRI